MNNRQKSESDFPEFGFIPEKSIPWKYIKSSG